MKNLEHNAIERSLGLIGYRNALAIHRRRHEADSYRLAEVFQQYQIEVSGTSGTGAFVDADINFQEVLYYAPLQRNSKTEDPHVTHGVSVDSGEARFAVYVVRWLLDQNANYTGAVVRIGVEQLGYAPASAFAATIHITFQGLGVPVEDAGFDDTP